MVLDEEDEYLEAKAKESQEDKWWLNPWYLDAKSKENIYQIEDCCTKCDPFMSFEKDTEAHKKHMQMIHGSSIYFRDVDWQTKVKSAESLYKYFEHGYDSDDSEEERSLLTTVLPCTCEWDPVR